MKSTKFIILAVLSGLLLGTIMLVSCSSEEQASTVISSSANLRQVDNKLSTFAEYLNAQGLLRNDMRVDLERSFAERIEGVEVLFLVVNNNQDGGLIKGIKTSEEGREMVPMNKEYLVIYEEYSNLNEEMSSATIKMYDWNYDKQFGYLVIEDSEILIHDTYPVTTNSNPCTGGADGNVSWGECYSCMKNACSSDPTCDSLCDAVNLMSGVYAAVSLTPYLGAASSCYGTMAIACVAIAAIY